MKTPALSPRWMLLWALRLVVLPGVLHLCGARAQVSVLSGTLAHPVAMVAGAAYALTWLLAVVLAPPLALAAGLAALVGRRSLSPGPSPTGEGSDLPG